MPDAPKQLWAPRAWLPEGWHEAVLMEVDATGHWSRITPHVGQPPAGARILAGPVLPALVDAHSHAFQRAFAGLSERRTHGADDFWSWRDRMYGVALRLTPDQMQAIAAQLYLELLRGGYTHVCEFHYLHHAPDGSPYADPATLCWSLADAAAEVGMGLTLLPVLYERAGFQQPLLRADQRRFASDAAHVLHLQRTVRATGRPLLQAGVAIHSLRAARPGSLAQLRAALEDDDGPIHIHIAEQVQEVEDCLVATGLRPIDWLCRHAQPDARWHLVHATHATAQEIEAVANSGATAVICPGTEANLGDGLTDIPTWLAAGVPLAIGSDSHVTRQWTEELRWLEYGQRLRLRQRNVAADPAQADGATAARLLDTAVRAGGGSAGLPAWGLVHHARADALVLDATDPAVLGIPQSHLLDALVFSAPSHSFREVLVAGRSVLRDGAHPQEATILARFTAAMESLWQEGAAGAP